MTKYIFVTGGVVSSLGKGIVSASVGRILKNKNIHVSIMKLDPYLNVDPGTMSPFQHGEVFVTSDGSETDLDLGHYERFINEELNKYSSTTAGAIYREIIENERDGKYLGGTIQTIPHVTNLIKEKIFLAAEKSNSEIMIVEVGGTIGDIEGQPFIEAIRQIRSEFGQENSLFLHLTLLPKLGATGEVKTKPTQHSVNSLRGMGIQPDFLVCRSDDEIDDEIKEKLSLHCDVKLDRVFSLETLDTIYAVPLALESQQLGGKISDFLNLNQDKSDLKNWVPTVANDPWLFQGKLIPIYEIINDAEKKKQLKIATQAHLDKAYLKVLMFLVLRLLIVLYFEAQRTGLDYRPPYKKKLTVKLRSPKVFRNQPHGIRAQFDNWFVFVVCFCATLTKL